MNSILALIRRIPTSIILSDINGKIIFVNKAACSKLNVAEEVLLEKTILVSNVNNENAMHADIKKWQDRPPQNSIKISVSSKLELSTINALVIAAGSNKYRFYVFLI